MADEATPVSETPKKASKGPSKAKKVKPAASHPKISIMVNAAIKDLKERGGSSLQAVKKYISSNYKVDVERMAPFIKKYLKTAVATGELVQTKGKGASGSFKLKGAGGKAEGNPKSTKAAKKKPKPASPAKRVASKPAKKTSVKKVTKKPKAEKKSKPAKSPKKPKAKAAAKPKPKPKKAAKPAPKKTAAKKGKR